jgi:lipoyl-dependent peroxiredoxin
VALERSATCSWEDGRISLPTRTGPPGDDTSPEELLAAAHAGCYAMALAAVLTGAEVPPGWLDVRCTVALEEVADGLRITRSALVVDAAVDGLSRDALRAAMDAADASCPYSALLRDAGARVDSDIAA